MSKALILRTWHIVVFKILDKRIGYSFHQGKDMNICHACWAYLVYSLCQQKQTVMHKQNNKNMMHSARTWLTQHVTLKCRHNKEEMAKQFRYSCDHKRGKSWGGACTEDTGWDHMQKDKRGMLRVSEFENFLDITTTSFSSWFAMRKAGRVTGTLFMLIISGHGVGREKIDKKRLSSDKSFQYQKMFWKKYMFQY